jgi:hypothetical protein
MMLMDHFEREGEGARKKSTKICKLEALKRVIAETHSKRDLRKQCSTSQHLPCVRGFVKLRRLVLSALFVLFFWPYLNVIS